jgi:hypothetical protein
MPRVTVGLPEHDDHSVLPGRVHLSLGELLFLARADGDLQLPVNVEVPERAPGRSRMVSRLGGGRATPSEEAHGLVAEQAAIASSQSDAVVERLRDRGLADPQGKPTSATRPISHSPRGTIQAMIQAQFSHGVRNNSRRVCVRYVCEDTHKQGGRTYECP